MNTQTRELLQSWMRRPTQPAGLVRCARALLLLEQGQHLAPTARQVSLSERHLRKWARRFGELGGAGLRERTRCGRPPVFAPHVVLSVVKLACERPDQFGPSLSQWNCSDLARQLQADGIVALISFETVRRILPSHKLRPWRSHLWLSRNPCLVINTSLNKSTSSLTFTLAHWPGGERVLCLDEKTNLQPRPRLTATKPTRPRLPTRLEHEYKRAGAIHLFAAFDTRTGKVTAQTAVRKRQKEFIALLARLEKGFPATVKRVFLVLDTSSIHHGKQMQQWLELHPHFVCHFLPVHCRLHESSRTAVQPLAA